MDRVCVYISYVRNTYISSDLNNMKAHSRRNTITHFSHLLIRNRYYIWVCYSFLFSFPSFHVFFWTFFFSFFNSSIRWLFISRFTIISGCHIHVYKMAKWNERRIKEKVSLQISSHKNVSKHTLKKRRKKKSGKKRSCAHMRLQKRQSKTEKHTYRNKESNNDNKKKIK